MRGYNLEGYIYGHLKRNIFKPVESRDNRSLLVTLLMDCDNENLLEFVLGVCYIIEKGKPEKRLPLTIAN